METLGCLACTVSGPTKSEPGKRSNTTATPDLSQFQQAFMDNIDNQQFYEHPNKWGCLMCKDGRIKDDYLNSADKSKGLGTIYPVGQVHMVQLVEGRRIPAIPETFGAISQGCIICMGGDQLGQFNSLAELRSEVRFEVDLIYLSGEYKGCSLNAVIEKRGDPIDPPPDIPLPPFPMHSAKRPTTMAPSTGGGREHLPRAEDIHLIWTADRSGQEFDLVRKIMSLLMYLASLIFLFVTAHGGLPPSQKKRGESPYQ